MTPGVVHPNVLNHYCPDIVLKHLLLVPPFVWESLPTSRDVDGLTVAWLMAVPIADSEVEFARLNGTQRLQEIFEQEQIDVFDIDQAPVL